MSYTIFTVTGCARCKVVKQVMTQRGIEFEEQNIKEEGKTAFQKFYRVHRKAIFRDADGVKFPMLTDGTIIRQDIGAAVAYLWAGTALDGFFGISSLHKEWVGGIYVSGGDAAHADAFIGVLRHIKVENNFKLQVDTSGPNSGILSRVLEENLADIVIMDLPGPRELYERITGRAVDMAEVEKSIALVARFPEYRFETTVAPIVRDDGAISYLTTGEVGATAALIAEHTGNMKNPYLIKRFDPKTAGDKRFESVAPMDAAAMLPYRTAARKHQVFAEIEKA